MTAYLTKLEHFVTITGQDEVTHREKKETTI